MKKGYIDERLGSFVKSKQRNGEFITFYNFNQLMNILRWEQDGNQLTTHVKTIALAVFSTFLPALQSGVFFQLAKFQMAGLKTKLKCTGNALVSSNHTANVAGSKRLWF